MAMRTLLLFALSTSVLLAVDYQREVRPILSDNCFQCHGPDGGTRMAGLRLDQRDSLVGKRAAILARVTETRPQRIMPPPSSHKKLAPEQIATLKRWIEEGAPWTAHWAYEAPVRPAVGTGNPIDVLVGNRLKGLRPAAEADKRTLARRAALDLTGLPPTKVDLDQFLRDGSYEKLLDRLLASPRYGEHRARYWLDAARYADTHGIHVDNYREMWPYRDWVIAAFNQNLSFDRFTTEQLAGDLLPSPTLEQRVATGFQRCNPTTNEAGLIEDEYAEIYAKDRADTVGAVWLGMTVGCAACHNHKFDPITQKDFYSMGAFFRNTTQNVMDDNIPDTPPILVVPRAEDRERWDQVSARRRALQSELDQRRTNADPKFEEWLRSARGKSIAGAPLSVKDELYVLKAPLRFAKNEGVPAVKAARLLADQAFTIAVSFYFPKTEQSYTVAAQQDADDKGRGWTIDVGSRVPAFRLIGDEGKNIEIRAGHLSQLAQGSWNHLVVSYDGTRHQSGLSLYLNGKAVPTQGGGNQNVQLPGRIDSAAPLLLGKSLADGEIADFRILKRVVSETEARVLADWPAIRKGEDREALRTYYLFHRDRIYPKLVAEQAKLQFEAKTIARRGAVTHVMQERSGSMPFANILFRGAYDQKREKVEANTPSVLPPMGADLPRNRLGLAQWLLKPENPLTARVAVNRMWQEVFGDGLVRTAEDFGSQGQAPVNPELLDWLAVDFREGGWDVKRFYKQVMLSATYRQAAVSTPEKLAQDPENRLLSRGPRFRMDGEMVRDYALASSGLLNGEIGGPSVKPYQPGGVWETVAMNGSNTRFYQADAGAKLYRRSVYWFWKRSAPPASMEIFNAPTREACTVRRERTNTPLQALVTMNDVQFIEAARVLGQRAYQVSTAFDPRADFLAEAVLGRPLAAAERQIAKKSFQEYLRYYDANLTDAKKLMAVGASPADAAVAPAEGAALTMLANQLLNLDEVLTK